MDEEQSYKSLRKFFFFKAFHTKLDFEKRKKKAQISFFFFFELERAQDDYEISNYENAKQTLLLNSNGEKTGIMLLVFVLD